MDLGRIEYRGFDFLPDPLAYRHQLTHRVKPHDDRPWRLFVHLVPTGRGAFCHSWADEWTRKGGPQVIHTRLRVREGRYTVLVGFADETGRRMEVAGSTDGRVAVGEIEVSQGTQLPLIRTGELLPTAPDALLGAVLDLEPTVGSGADHLELAYGLAPLSGHVMEFGVASGATIQRLADATPWRPIWGFDSFQGLPEPLDTGVDVRPAGTFTQGGRLPEVPANVSLVPGWFDATLEPWMREHPGNVGFLHIDADLYSSTRYVLSLLDARIVPGTVIVFDDLGMWSTLVRGDAGFYPRWADEEWRALVEWLHSHGRRIAPISRSADSTLALRVLT